MVYRIAHPDEYLAITGVGVGTVKITKSTWVWPLQRVIYPVFSLSRTLVTKFSVTDSAFSQRTTVSTSRP